MVLYVEELVHAILLESTELDEQTYRTCKCSFNDKVLLARNLKDDQYAFVESHAVKTALRTLSSRCNKSLRALSLISCEFIWAWGAITYLTCTDSGGGAHTLDMRLEYVDMEGLAHESGLAARR